MADAKIILSAVDQTRAAVASAKKNLAGLGEDAAGLAGRFGTLGTALAAVFTGATLKGAIDLLDQLDNLQEKTGVSVERLSGLRYAAELSDASIESLAQGMRKLAQFSTEANDKNSEQAKILQSLGIEVKKFAGDTEGLLLAIANKFASFRDGPEKAALAIKIFGKAGDELIPLLNRGADGIEKLRKEAESLGAVYGGDLAKQAADFNDNLKRLSINAEAAKVSIAGGLIPALNKLIEGYIEARRVGALGLIMKDAAKDMVGAGQLTDNAGADINALLAQRDKLRGDLAYIKKTSALPEHIRDVEGQLTNNAILLDWSRSRQAREALAGGGDTGDAISRRAGTGKTGAPNIAGQSGAANKAAQEAEKQKRLILELNGLSGSFTEDWNRLTEIWRAGHLSLDGLTKAQAQLLAKQPAIEAQAKTEKELADARAKISEHSDKLLEAGDKENDQAAERLRNMEFEVQTIGMTAEAVDLLVLARMSNAIAAERENLMRAQGIESNDREVAQIERRIRLMERERELAGVAVGNKRADAERQASEDIARGVHQDLRGAIGDALRDPNPIKSFAANLASTVNKRLTDGIADALATSLLGFDSKGQGGGGGLLGGLMNLFGGASIGAGTAAGGAYAAGDIGASFAGFFAEGGYLKPGQWGIAGERGPEPIYGGKTGLTVQPAGGGGQVIQMTINMTVGDVATGETVRQAMRQVKNEVAGAFSRSQRMG